MLSLPYVFFLIGSLSSLSIILFKKRNFDFNSIFILVLFLYTIPLFFGYVNDPYTSLFVVPDERVFLVMAIPYYISLLFLINDNCDSKVNDYYSGELFLKFILIISLLGFFVYFPTIMSSKSKVELLENSNMLVSVIYSTLPVFGFLAALKFNNKRYIYMFLGLLLLIFLFGARRSLALAVIGSLVVLLHEHKLILLKQYKVIALGLVGIVLVLLGKVMYGYVLSHGIVNGINTWKDEFSYDFLITGSEFLTTSAILNNVLINDFNTDKIYYFYSFLALQPLPLSYFNYSSSYFNDVFQPVLFPGLYYGMAYNPWAEVYSAFGYMGVILLSFLIFGLLKFFWFMYRRSKNIWSLLFLMLGIYFAFWIQRNSLGSIFAYLRNVFYPLLFIIFIYLFISKFFKVRK